MQCLECWARFGFIILKKVPSTIERVTFYSKCITTGVGAQLYHVACYMILNLMIATTSIHPKQCDGLDLQIILKLSCAKLKISFCSSDRNMEMVLRKSGEL